MPTSLRRLLYTPRVLFARSGICVTLYSDVGNTNPRINIRVFGGAGQHFTQYLWPRGFTVSIRVGPTTPTQFNTNQFRAPVFFITRTEGRYIY